MGPGEFLNINFFTALFTLANTLALFFVLKKFLFKPVKNVLDKRRAELDERYAAAEAAEASANQSRESWEKTLSGARSEADAILQEASEQAKARGDKLVAEAKEKADGIIESARSEAELEKQKAADEIRREIVAVSGALAEKLLEREINTDDHRALIDSAIKEMGDGND